MEKRFLDKGMGVNLLELELNEYAFGRDVQIDCENRVPLCQGVCYRLWFPPSKQDVYEGVVQWGES